VFAADAKPSSVPIFGYRCPFGKPGDLLWCRETFWAKNDTCDHEYCPGCDMGSMLDKDHPCPIDYVATPRCFDGPPTKYQQTVESWNEPPVPGGWWLAPPDDWDGESDEDHERRGEWGFLPWPFYTKHPSVHMPRWASRTQLVVLDVRVQRVQDISFDDAVAEGVEMRLGNRGRTPFWRGGEKWWTVPERAFAALWDSRNAKRGYPWSDTDLPESMRTGHGRVLYGNPWVWALTVERKD
jgi:hypothetical protein